MAQVKNERNGQLLVMDLEFAKGTLKRMKGLLGRRNLPQGQGLWFDRTNSIHTFFMKFTIDVVFLDGDGTVRGLVKELRPWRLVLPVLSAVNCLELPAGTLQRTDTRKGDHLRVEA